MQVNLHTGCSFLNLRPRPKKNYERISLQQQRLLLKMYFAYYETSSYSEDKMRFFQSCILLLGYLFSSCCLCVIAKVRDTRVETPSGCKT